MNNVTLLKMIMIQSSGTLVNLYQPLQSLDTKGKVVYISTFSKSLYPSCRIAYIVLPKEISNIKQRKLKEGNTVPSTFNIWLHNLWQVVALKDI